MHSLFVRCVFCDSIVTVDSVWQYKADLEQYGSPSRRTSRSMAVLQSNNRQTNSTQSTTHIARRLIEDFIFSCRCTASTSRCHWNPFRLLRPMITATWHWELCPQHGCLGSFLLCIHHRQLFSILTSSQPNTTSLCQTSVYDHYSIKLGIITQNKQHIGCEAQLAEKLHKYLLWQPINPVN